MENFKAAAIVGMGAILPDAFDAAAFWQNIKTRRYSITDVPADRWREDLYFDPDPSAVDKTYCKIGAWVKGYHFEPLKVGMAIPPKVLAVMDEAQQWAIAASRQALLDYGYPGRALDNDRVAVIFGNALAGESHYRSSLRINLPEYLDILSTLPEFQNLPDLVRHSLVLGMQTGIRSRIADITEDTMPGELSNIIAGRVANLFNFSGPNYVTDAACASSVAALQNAIEGLFSFQFDAVLTGGIDRNMGPESFVKFSKIGALSPDGSRPYADGANGFVMGEGAVVFLLKRLADAEKDGDRIYAVVRGVAGSSDGKGKGITAPNPLGQQRAIERAWKNAGVSPASVGLIEGHGTSTRVGDVTEVGSMNTVLGSLGLACGAVALGSVKSNIGHLKSAAGAAGLLKVAMALHERVLPPTANFERPNPNIDFSHTPFYPNTELRPWEVKAGGVRRAGISSFGFGGTNFHVVVEEYLPGMLTGEKTFALPAVEMSAGVPVLQTAAPEVVTASGPARQEITEKVLALVSEKTGYPMEMLDLELDLEGDLGVDTVKQAELFAAARGLYGIPRREDLRLSDYNTLTRVIAFVEDALASQGVPATPGQAVPATAVQAAPLSPIHPDCSTPTTTEAKPTNGLLFLGADSTADLKEALAEAVQKAKQGILPERRCPDKSQLSQPERLAVDFSDGAELLKRADKALKALDGDNPGAWAALAAQGIFRGSGRLGKMAFMFPGQGSQYINMLDELRRVEPAVADTFREADEIMTPILGRPLSSYIFVEGGEEAVLEAEKELRNTALTQPAMLTANVALLRVMTKYGFKPDMVIGHSLGEYAALVAAGVLTFAEALEVVSARGREMSRVSMDDNGVMLAVSAPLEEVEQVINTLEGYAVIANINSPMQSVVGGSTAAMDAAMAVFQKAGYQATKIPVSHAFHTKIVAPASEPLKKVIERMAIQPPRLPVVANVTGELYPSSREEIIDLLARQIASPVQMVKSMQTLYNQGVRVYVEIGPKRVLNALATDNLKSYSDVVIIGTNHPRKGALVSLNEALCGLYAAGVSTESQVENKPAVAVPASARAVETFHANPAVIQDGRLPLTGSVVISGAGLGLPGTRGRVFDDRNIERILKGEMLIEPFNETKRSAMLDKRVTRLVKSEAGAVMEVINDLEQTVKLAGQSGSFNLEEEFGVPAERVEATDIATQLAIAAGIEALHDAGIPLVMAYRRTSRGTLLPDRWRLPEALADETGVIFGSAFPGLDQMAVETGRYYELQALLRQREELGSIQSQLPSGQKDLYGQDLFANRIQEIDDQIARLDYHFDRRFIFRVLAMGHSQFAEHIGARGPNTHVNAACATTTHAVSIAEDWIRTGRCRRVVIVSGDDVSDGSLVSWIGTGLMASGAATTEGDPRKAILPFDRRRNGLIMGMGAAALVVESEDAVRERGMKGICEILATHTANSAFHGTRLDVQHVAGIMDRLVTTAEQRYHLRRDEIASATMFVSHETYTPARGGSAAAEIRALRQTFGSQADRVVIANTKGFTGHTMGVGIEDVVAVKALEFGIVPPIANIHDGFEPDPDLGSLNLSRGGQYPVEYALRLGAGFGSQVAMSLIRKIAGAGERVDREVYDRWLANAAGYEKADLEVTQRTLRIHHTGPPVRTPMGSNWQYGQGPTLWAKGTGPAGEPNAAFKAEPAVPAGVNTPAPKVSVQPAGVPGNQEITSKVLELVSEKTGYPVEMLDLELDLEGDLGIDTVKQAELFASVRGLYNIPRREDLRLSDYNTLTKVVGFVQEALGLQSPAPSAAVMQVAPEPGIVETSPLASPTGLPADEEITSKVLALVSEKTGYPVEMLDLELDLEGDLGIDTVKQAELFASVRGLYNIPRREDLRLSDYNTLTKVVSFVKEALNEAGREGAKDPAQQTGQGGGPQPLEQTMTAIRRRVVVPVLRPRLDLCNETGVTLDAGRRVLVVRDRGRTADALIRQLRARKVTVVDIQADDPAFGDKTAAWQGEGELHGVYFLPALDKEPGLAEMSIEDWHSALEDRLIRLYDIMSLVKGNAFLVCATRMGGLSGCSPSSNDSPLGGAVSGFTKALAWERPDGLIKVVDFETGVAAKTIAACLVDETLSDAGVVEVGWEGGLRFTPVLQEQPLSTAVESLSLDGNTVYLVSGGSGGITAPVVADLAQASGGTYYLLGRTPLPDAGDPMLALLNGERSELKTALAESLAQDGKKVTPAQVEQKLAALERGAATLDTMAAVAQAGGRIHYLACDVTHPDSVKEAIRTIAEKEGRVDVFIHAAGQERSRRLENKPVDEFRRVFTVKADGFFHIFKSLEAYSMRPKAVAFFSSVAGRFGNSGQTDYSAANDLLIKLASSLGKQAAGTKFVGLDWGAWDEVGMASRGHIPELMKRAGIDMLKPADAAPLVRRELVYGKDSEVVLAGELGLLESARRPDAGINTIRANTALREGSPSHKMLSQLTGMTLKEGILLEAELDPSAEPFLRDHAINGVPVLPGVMGIEGFTVAAKHIASVLATSREGFEVACLEDIHFMTPFKFYRGEPRRISWKAQAVRQSEGLVVYVTLESDIARRSGQTEHMLHFSGRVHLQHEEPAAGSVSDLPAWNGGMTVKAEDIYRLFFHGPSFQILDGVQKTGTGVIGRLRADLPAMLSGDRRSLMTPILVELCFQTAGLWEAGKTGVMALPQSIGSLKLFHGCFNGAPVFAEVTPLEGVDGTLSFNARVVGEDGCLYLELEDYRTSPMPYPAELDAIQPMQALVGSAN